MKNSNKLVAAALSALLLSGCAACGNPTSDSDQVTDPTVNSDSTNTVTVTSGTLAPTISAQATVISNTAFTLTASAQGVFQASAKVGDVVKAQQVLGWVDSTPITSPVEGTIVSVAGSGVTVPRNYPVVTLTYSGFALQTDATRLLRMTDSSDNLSGKFQITNGEGPTSCAAVVLSRQAAESSTDSSSGTTDSNTTDGSGDQSTAGSIAYKPTAEPSRVIPISAYVKDPDDANASGGTDDGGEASSNGDSASDNDAAASGDSASAGGTSSGSGTASSGNANSSTNGGNTSNGFASTAPSSSTTMACLVGKDIDVREGESGTLVLTASATQQSLLLPVSAVAGRSGKGTVTKVTDDGQEQVSVELGASDGARIVITSGLSEGDTVLATAPNLTVKQTQ
ncbi:hypothetical protein BLEM_0791 [Bifidobacterium lemurum]|uniref:Uncharacterized protein n=1 Tax=Bifidobacterium lemurum TaxID=1603886 RepID=A0A261FTE6_9BIFI|nr:hypothetical protein BLEM_0791 [Bifidobacterium lemurum]